MPSAKPSLEALRTRSIFCQQFSTSPPLCIVQIQQLSGLPQPPLRQLAALRAPTAQPPKPGNAVLTQGGVSRLKNPIYWGEIFETSFYTPPLYLLRLSLSHKGYMKILLIKNQVNSAKFIGRARATT